MDSLSLCGWQSTYQPTYHQTHPYSGEESPPCSPIYNGSYSSFAPSRTDTGIGFDSMTLSGDYRDRSVSPSTRPSHNDDSGAHCRPSTGNKSRQKVEVLQVKQQILNNAANDFSDRPSLPLPPVTVSQGRHRNTAVSRSSQSDSSSSSDSSPFSLSIDLEGSHRSASEMPKHLDDDTTTCAASFARIFENFVWILLQLDSLSNEDHEDRRQLLPGLGLKM